MEQMSGQARRCIHLAVSMKYLALSFFKWYFSSEVIRYSICCCAARAHGRKHAVNPRVIGFVIHEFSESAGIV